MFYRKYEVYHDLAQTVDVYHCDTMSEANGTVTLGAVFDRRGVFMCDIVYLSLSRGTVRVNVNRGWDEVDNLVQLKVA